MTEQDVKIEIPMKTGFVYKLCCRDLEVKEIYVGSTSNLKNRKHGHKRSCTIETDKDYNSPVYTFIRANGGFHNWDLIQIERVEFNTRFELHARERHYIELLRATLNKQIPTRTKKEYYDEHKEEQKEIVKKYYEDNKDQKKEYQKEYYIENKNQINEKAKEYRETHKEKYKEKDKKYYEKNKEEIKEKVKKYYETHKEERLQKDKKYYEENKEEIKQYNKKYREKNKQRLNQRVICQCGGDYSIAGKAQHFKTRLHKRNLENINRSNETGDDLSYSTAEVRELMSNA
jgi:hypothetical protein